MLYVNSIHICQLVTFLSLFSFPRGGEGGEQAYKITMPSIYVCPLISSEAIE
jgi:hypothetical protein